MALKSCKDTEKRNIETDIRVETQKDQNEKTEKNFIDLTYKFFKYIGIATTKTVSDSMQLMDRFYHKSVKKHVENFKINTLDKVARLFKNCAMSVFNETKRLFKFFCDGFRVLKSAYKSETTFTKKISATVKAFKTGCKNNKTIFSTTLNYSLPIIAIFALGYLVNFVFGLTFAVEVEYNGAHVGYVENEIVFEEAESKLQSRMIYKEEDDQVQTVPTFKVEVVPKEKLMTASQLTDTMIMSSNDDIIEAEGITVDGQFIGAVKEVGTIEETLNTILDEKKAKEADAEVKFAKDVQIETGLFITQNIRQVDEIVETLTSSNQTDMYYQIAANDTPIIIAKKNNMSLDELVSLNPNILKKCVIGDNVLVSKSKPFLPVSVTKTEVYTVSVPFETTTTTSTQYSKGYTKINKKGEKGENVITANVQYVDGIEVKREVLDTKVVKAPVNQLEVKGTGYFASSDYAGTYDGPPSNGKFVWPVTGGYISSRYGGGHGAIDIAKRGGAYGSPIYAAASGKVVFAGWSGTYGKLIKIDHGNGLQTWYAHCSDISPVSVGKTVSQGQIIGKVGSTGKSTGPHLHFEVRQNGSKRNPMSYLP